MNAQQKISETLENQDQAKEVVKQFFTAFGSGNKEDLLATFHGNCKIVAVRNTSRNPGELYGTYSGKSGVEEFLKNLFTHFQTKSFDIEIIGGEGNYGFAKGTFAHELKSNQKLYESGWSLICKVEDGKIMEYFFYEDSGAFEKIKAL